MTIALSSLSFLHTLSSQQSWLRETELRSMWHMVNSQLCYCKRPVNTQPTSALAFWPLLLHRKSNHVRGGTATVLCDRSLLPLTFW